MWVPETLLASLPAVLRPVPDFLQWAQGMAEWMYADGLNQYVVGEDSLEVGPGLCSRCTLGVLRDLSHLGWGFAWPWVMPTEQPPCNPIMSPSGFSLRPTLSPSLAYGMLAGVGQNSGHGLTASFSNLTPSLALSGPGSVDPALGQIQAWAQDPQVLLESSLQFSGVWAWARGNSGAGEPRARPGSRQAI